MVLWLFCIEPSVKTGLCCG